MPRNVRFVAELTDGDPPLLRARCTELDVAISISTGAYRSPTLALGATVADVVAAKIPRGESRRVVVDLMRGRDDDGHELRPERLHDFDLRERLELLDRDDGLDRERAFRETVPA